MTCPKCINPIATLDIDNHPRDVVDGDHVICGHCATILKMDKNILVVATTDDLLNLDHGVLMDLHLARAEVAADLIRRGHI